MLDAALSVPDDAIVIAKVMDQEHTPTAGEIMANWQPGSIYPSAYEGPHATALIYLGVCMGTQICALVGSSGMGLQC